MILRNSRMWAALRQRGLRAAGLALPACTAVAACSNSPPPPPDTYVNATLGPARDANNNNLCSFSSQKSALAIGVVDMNSGAAKTPLPQADGSSQAGAGVNVQCSVTGGFDVSLEAVLAPSSANGGGSLVISGHVDPDNGGSSITSSLNSQDVGGNFGSSACTITFKYLGGSIPTSPAITAGRIWAHLSCPTMQSTDLKSVMIGTTQVVETCDVEADFLFENCAQ